MAYGSYCLINQHNESGDEENMKTTLCSQKIIIFLKLTMITIEKIKLNKIIRK